jgi:hypothetical protein
VKSTGKNSRSDYRKPGNPQRYSSFFTCHEIEAVCAGYLACDSIVSFRRLLVTPPVLAACAFSLSFKVDLQQKRLLDKIRLALKEDLPNQSLEAKLDEWSARVDSNGQADGTELDKNACLREIALAIIWMVRSLEELSAQGEDQTFTKESRDSARYLFDKVIAAPWRDSLRHTATKAPTFSFSMEDPTESSLEKYNRGINLLRHLKFRTVKSKWQQFNKESAFSCDPQSAMKVEDEHKPYWMRSQRQAANKPAKPVDDFSSHLAFKVRWIIPPNSELARQVREEGRSLHSPLIQDGWAAYHPLNSTFEKFRDGIRRQFLLQSQGLKLDTLQIAYGDSETLPARIWPPSSATRPWKGVQDKLRSKSVEKCCFTFRAEEPEVGEDEALAYEADVSEEEWPKDLSSSSVKAAAATELSH